MQPSIGDRQSGTIPLLLAITVALAVGCSDSTGPTRQKTPSFQVSIVTTGADLDPDGFDVVVDDSIRRPVAVNDTITVPDVAVGTHWVRLERVATNCVIRPQPWPVFVGPGAGGSPSVSLAVSCFTRSIPPALAATQLLFVRDGQIYHTRLDGTGLVALGSGYTPVWSPDGQRIAFGSGDDLYVVDADGGNVQRVAGNPGIGALFPTWSPDGRRLAYDFVDSAGVETEELPQTTAVVSLDGASAPVIIPNSYAPAWSPDGSRIAFGVWGTETSVWSVASDGSDRKELLPGQRVNWSPATPAWSPDGKQIAVAGYDGVSVMNADGSNRRVLFSLMGTLYRPAWSPDGQAIAFGVVACNGDGPRPGRGCAPHVFYATADGSTIGLLLENGDSPSWHK